MLRYSRIAAGLGTLGLFITALTGAPAATAAEPRLRSEAKAAVASPPGSAVISRRIDLTGDKNTGQAKLPAEPAPSRLIRLDPGTYNFGVSLNGQGYSLNFTNVPGGEYYWRCYLTGTGVAYKDGINYRGNCLLDPKWTDSFNIWLPLQPVAVGWRIPTGQGYLWESWLKKI